MSTKDTMEEVLAIARQINKIEDDAETKAAPLREKLRALLNRSGSKTPKTERKKKIEREADDRATVHAAAAILVVLTNSTPKSSGELVRLTKLSRRDIMAGLSYLVRQKKIVVWKDVGTMRTEYRRK